MNSIVLSEKEISFIDSFNQEATNIPLVECVYIVPYIAGEQKEEKIRVITLWNDSQYYNGLLNGNEEKRNIIRERTELDTLIEKYNQESINSRVSFTKESSENYTLAFKNDRNLIAEVSLVSGIILFDRFGLMKANRNDALEELYPYNNILQVDNIDMLLFKATKRVKHQ